MEAMRNDLATEGYDIGVVAVNLQGQEATQSLLTARCSFDCVQDTAAANVWGLMGGKKDDFFIYRSGGGLGAGGYLSAFGPISANLATREGYANVHNAVTGAHETSPGPDCGAAEGGLQVSGDANQDTRVDLADAVAMLDHLFRGSRMSLPCDGGDVTGSGHRLLLSVNGDDQLDLADPVYILTYLFSGGAPPLLGAGCRPIPGCESLCSR
jgi:hypothetical protein